MKIFGIQFIFSTQEASLWWDHDQHHDGSGKPGWGVVFKLRGGNVVRPWAKKGFNPWFDTSPDNGRRVIKFYCPLPILPFFSIAIGDYGFYIGFKDV